eukprot:9516747-Ditylum_brightwellii.AAC.1
MIITPGMNPVRENWMETQWIRVAETQMTTECNQRLLMRMHSKEDPPNIEHHNLFKSLLERTAQLETRTIGMA